MRVSLCKEDSSVPILTSFEDVASLVEEEKRLILTEWLASLNKGSGKQPLIYYCRQGSFNKVEYSGMHFSAHDFQKDGKNCNNLVAQGVYLFNTMILPSSTPSTFGLPGSNLFHIFQRLDVLYCQLCFNSSSPLRPLLTPISYKNKATSALISHVTAKHSISNQKNLSSTPSREYNRLLCFALISNLMSFRIVDDRSFRQILQSDTVPHRNTLSTVHLTSLHDDFVSSLHSAIDESHLHISFDLWSSVR